ncbi:MAG: peptidyl-prolyl cis-trans isomerase, partial [Bradyrhizobium sp.]|nr:peptidyl-prolyl cis-trans isomerase [Bradyrhizobium sp.]
MIKRLLREPLLHFLLLGAVLFAAHGFLSRSSAGGPGSIVVTQVQIESMARLFARARQRPPSDSELEELVRGHVREEVFYREGLALGLDRDDPVIRRRVAQKLEFVIEAPEA